MIKDNIDCVEIVDCADVSVKQRLFDVLETNEVHKQLSILAMTNCRLTDDECNRFTFCLHQKLRGIGLSGNDDISLEQWTLLWKHLQCCRPSRVDFSENALSDKEVDVLIPLLPTSIEELFLDKNRVSTSTDFRGLAKLSNLRFLDLADNYLTDGCLEGILYVMEVTPVSELVLAGNPLFMKDGGVSFLSKLSKTIRILHIGDTAFDDRGLVCLAAHLCEGALPNLEELHLEETRIADEAVKDYLLPCLANSPIVYLNISKNEIAQETMDAVCKIMQKKQNDSDDKENRRISMQSINSP